MSSLSISPAQAEKGGGETLNKSPFKVRGIYFHDGFAVEPKMHAPLYWGEKEWRREIEWLHACGINTIEFATMLEFIRIPSTEMEKNKIADRLKTLGLAHSLAMKFGYVLTNTTVSTVPVGEEPSCQRDDYEGKNRVANLCPRKLGNFERTISLIEWYMNTYKEADFFEMFAADWGGCYCGRCGIADYLRYVRVPAEDLAVLNLQGEPQ